MKKIATILSHLSSKPQFKSLNQQTCYQKYINLLTPKWQKAVAFIYLKDDTLFIAVTHPGFKMEFNYNKDLLKSLLIQLNNYDKTCEKMLASKVVIFHSKYHPVDKDKDSYLSVPYYHERAIGHFNLPKEEKLQEIFKRIQHNITCKK